MSTREDFMSRPNRRNFLKSAAATGAAALTTNPRPARAQETRPVRISAPSAAGRKAETGTPAAAVEVLTGDRPGADFMIDVLKSLGFEYICANPGSSFRGLHESVINYGGNHNPEF